MTVSQKTGPSVRTGVSPGVGLEPIGPSGPPLGAALALTAVTTVAGTP